MSACCTPHLTVTRNVVPALEMGKVDKLKRVGGLHHLHSRMVARRA